MSDSRNRPVLNLRQPEAFAAVDALVDALQSGVDDSDADAYDALFADDILWDLDQALTEATKGDA